MRIANRFFSLLQKLYFAAAVLAMVTPICDAANAADPVMPSPPAPILAPAAPSSLTLPVLAPLASGNDPTKQSGDISKMASSMEDKVTDNAKGVMKKLDNPIDPVMLEDLNTARQTVARIEAMIDIEKHLVELDKLRADHGHNSSASLANAIPASALAPMPPKTIEPIHRAAAESDIVRIIGADGKYAAVLKSSEGNKTVRTGDKLSNGAVVLSITASTVEIEDNGTTHTMRIKNADSIYSAMR